MFHRGGGNFLGGNPSIARDLGHDLAVRNESRVGEGDVKHGAPGAAGSVPGASSTDQNQYTKSSGNSSSGSSNQPAINTEAMHSSSSTTAVPPTAGTGHRQSSHAKEERAADQAASSH